MAFGNVDQDFDSYRRQRMRSQSRIGADAQSGYENSALRELELVEQREVRDQQLTREVHEFFAAATRQAATIVERMANDAVAQADERIEREVESFLIDSFARMNTLVLAMLQKKRGNAGEEKLEPNLNNIVGATLDEFRWEGTADLPDKHIGQDPFAIDLEDVRRELLGSVAGGEVGEEGLPLASISEHLVAAMQGEEVAEEEPAVEPGDEEVAPEEPAEAEAVEPEPGPQARGGVHDEELDRFKQALKSLVRQGTMSRDEARAAWATRLRSLGLV